MQERREEVPRPKDRTITHDGLWVHRHRLEIGSLTVWQRCPVVQVVL